MSITTGEAGRENEIRAAVDALLSVMSLEEKLGQMTQGVGEGLAAIGSAAQSAPMEDLIRAGKIGSSIQTGKPAEMAARIREYQRIAVEESRLGIPLIFCQDVIHGFETVFPIPLAWACSFDPDRVRAAVAASAREASACGIMCAFAPMLDISRDPRWGRVAESTGEDPWLGGQMARATVLGLQNGMPGTDETGLIACMKHFIGYGAAEAGRDYNTVEISENTLRNIYLPPFRAGIEAGVMAVMPAFNVMNGVPMAANARLLRGLLRSELEFDGVIVSDFAAVMELIAHGAADGEAEAALKALRAGVDIEMATSLMQRSLPALIEKDDSLAALVDEAVRRILTLKYRIGIFREPYKYLREEEISSVVFGEAHLAQSRDLARRSAVLLKNNGVLPFDRSAKVALIGPFADSVDLCGCWSFSTRKDETVTLAQGLRGKGVDVSVERGCEPLRTAEGGIDRAMALADEADIVLLALGETAVISGEACSRMDISVPACQQELAWAVAAVGKPTVLLLTNGRPLLLDRFAQRMDAILEIWAPGSQGGAAAADLLVGDFAPVGKLSMSFPAHTGQIPVYYNALPTGRPYIEGSNAHFLSKYIDGPNAPLYPFGFGLTYTTFALNQLTLDRPGFSPGEVLTASVTLTNTGKRLGEETVQFYVRDCAASVSRPVKELKGFVKAVMEPGQSQTLTFAITEEQLRFYNEAGEYVSEPGRFELMAGLNSAEVITAAFCLEV